MNNSKTRRTVSTPYGEWEVAATESQYTYAKEALAVSVRQVSVEDTFTINGKTYGYLGWLDINERGVWGGWGDELTDSAKAKLAAELWPTAKEMLESDEVREAVAANAIHFAEQHAEHLLDMARRDGERGIQEARDRATRILASK